MDRRERVESDQDSLIAALSGWQADIQTCMPGIIQSFDATKQTCVVQPALKALIESQIDGTKSWIKLPLLVDCPVQFPSGGGYTLTFPVTAGDECLVAFSSRCIDAWWQSGGIQQQSMLRMHDLSDGMVFVGIKSLPHIPSAISTNSVQLRSNAGSTYIDLVEEMVTVVSTNVIVNSTNATVNAAGAATITAPSIILKNTGATLKKLLNSAFATWASGHVHSNGNGGANTGAPTTVAGATSQTSVVQAE
jgi:hypothetical protein